MREHAAPFAVLVALVSMPLPANAQRYWDRSYAPYAYYSTIDGFWFAGYARAYSPVIGTAERPEPHLASLGIQAAASTQGSYVVRGEAQAPAWWDGWRAAVGLTLERRNRLGYYGLGNGTVHSADSTGGGARPYFYRVSRTIASARATVQRRIVGPLRALLGATVSRTDYRSLPGETVFARDINAAILDARDLPFSDAAVRAGLVFDGRDHEIDPHAGIFVEALYSAGSGYRRATGSMRVFAHPVAKLVLGARAAGERTTGDPPLAAQHVMESSADPVAAVGGYHSLRGYPDGRFTGPGKLVAGLEARYALIHLPPYELKLFGFYDVGRVFGPGEAFRVTTDGLHAGGGGGAAARLGRNTLLVVGAGFTDEGWQLLFQTGWAY